MSDTRTIDPLVHMHAWEEGTLEIDDIIDLFQYLIDVRMIANLPARYGRTAQDLLDCGLCRSLEN